MTPAEAIAKYLRSEASATTAVVSDRVYWPYSKTEPTMPYACVRLSSTRRIVTMLSGAGAPREYAVEVMCFGATQTEAWTVADAIRSDLDNRTGTTPATGGIRFKQCYCSDESEPISESDFAAGVFAVAQTYTVIT